MIHAEDTLVALLAAGKPPAVAAALSGTSTRTVFRRMADPAFRARVDAARADFRERLMNKLAGELAAAAVA